MSAERATQCGPCDYGLTMACVCPPDDYRARHRQPEKESLRMDATPTPAGLRLSLHLVLGRLHLARALTRDLTPEEQALINKIADFGARADLADGPDVTWAPLRARGGKRKAQAQALLLVLDVLDRSIQIAKEEHEAMGHRSEDVPCWQAWAAEDFRTMVKLAADELGVRLRCPTIHPRVASAEGHSSSSPTTNPS